MKNIEKYIVGGVAVALFLYLDYLGKDTYASQIFGALMGVFGLVFGFEQGKNHILNMGEKEIKEKKKEIFL